jgi:hypothetical protein
MQNTVINGKIFINCTPHNINLNNGTEIKTSGISIRVSQAFGKPNNNLIAPVVWGDVKGLPEQKIDTFLIVSGFVKQAVPERTDLVVPATGHPDTIRNAKGHIVSVPCFI